MVVWNTCNCDKLIKSQLEDIKAQLQEIATIIT